MESALDDPELNRADYEDLSHSLKTYFKSWDCWLLSGNPELTKFLKMKSKQKHQVYNGSIDCRFLNYKIN